MENFSRQRPITLVSFLSICFLAGLFFSGYFEMSEVDIFFPNLSFEDQDLGTLTTAEKVKVNLSSSCFFEHPLLPICNSSLQASLVLPIYLDNQINCPIRC